MSTAVGSALEEQFGGRIHEDRADHGKAASDDSLARPSEGMETGNGVQQLLQDVRSQDGNDEENFVPVGTIHNPSLWADRDLFLLGFAYASPSKLEDIRGKYLEHIPQVDTQGIAAKMEDCLGGLDLVLPAAAFKGIRARRATVQPLNGPEVTDRGMQVAVGGRVHQGGWA
ncbi:Uu.00g084200.m01.CDS01 [Anthostomella pinea]|uniref:Uu.00g084200.m01.CDS01 n=1 Tax=Anthostomella pinea TaxID=933095 RepID=A0AAI8VLQ8_9PEZI|nr:Uu.00g084200.m01.CDS01 [Anthostomella pinea]